MSIASEITRINNNIASAYTSCNNKGATMPVSQNSANLATCIDSIQTGGSSSNGEYDVVVIDYDGTILKKESLDIGDTFTLPTPPTHSGLSFQSWSSPEPITNNTVTVTDNDIVIAPTYTTLSGHNEIEIELNKTTGLTINSSLSGNIDWGDGTTEEGSGAVTHTYTDYGTYIITNDFTTQIPSVYYDSDSKTSVVKGCRLAVSGSYAHSSSQFRYIPVKYITMAEETKVSVGSLLLISSLIYPSGTTSIEIGTSTNLKDSIKYIVIPNTVTKISGSFNRCHTLKYLNIPNSVINVGSIYSTSSQGSGFYQVSIKKFAAPSASTVPLAAFSQAFLLEKLVLREGISTLTITSNPVITANSFQLYSLRYIKFPSTITTVGALFPTAIYDTIYDFSSCLSIPTLSSATPDIPLGTKIKVPQSLYNNWIAATNWARYAAYIIGV